MKTFPYFFLQTSEKHHASYKLESSLVIKHLTKSDFGSYKCISKNSLGETEGTIMLYGDCFAS